MNQMSRYRRWDRLREAPRTGFIDRSHGHAAKRIYCEHVGLIFTKPLCRDDRGAWRERLVRSDRLREAPGAGFVDRSHGQSPGRVDREHVGLILADPL